MHQETAAKAEAKLNAKAAQTAYYREWRRKNPDKVRQYQERYWQRKYERMQAEASAEG